MADNKNLFTQDEEFVSIDEEDMDVDVYDAEEPLEIQLVPGGNRLSEVVVVGYGTQKKAQPKY